MKVSTQKPFQIVYSLFEHQYLGVLFESFVVQLDEYNKLTLQHQNISLTNANEFASGLDSIDYELIELMDSMQQDAVIKKFYSKKIKASDFFFTVYHQEKGDKPLQEAIYRYLEGKRREVLKRLPYKMFFEMANDGEPTHKRVEIEKQEASVLFHFYKNEENTHYLPTIKHEGKKLHFQYENASIICDYPAYLLLKQKVYSFQKNVDGKKLRPFLKKGRIVIPKKIEDSYYRKFVSQLVQSFDVHAKGFDIYKVICKPIPTLSVSEIASVVPTLFGNSNEPATEPEKIVFNLTFTYQGFTLGIAEKEEISVKVTKEDDYYIFHKIYRETALENTLEKQLQDAGLNLIRGKTSLEKTQAFGWLNSNRELLKKLGIEIQQFNSKTDKKYFLGEASINLQITEKNDWFDINAIVCFGTYKISFVNLRKLILSGKKEFKLPNGEIAIIPDTWFSQYTELFHFMKSDKESQHLEKHHLSLVSNMAENHWANVSMSDKIQKLRSFDKIEEKQMPKGFKGKLRPYQQAGFNWLHFLNEYHFGGCLADDMGLGKTVQTLAILQAEKESEEPKPATLLVMPTSLLYNWQMEAMKFTPELKVLRYTGSDRNKDVKRFDNYDLVITSYGIIRIDVEVLAEYYFNYIILDESQVIKNPSSNIAKAVGELKAKRRLILTGTPIENSTLDLWSQMNFVNPGLLGSQAFFKQKYLYPIEKLKSEEAAQKLNNIIKPFVMRRHKAQVATDLPGKVEKVQFCDMSAEQKEIYEETKSQYRNLILEQIETQGIAKSQFLLLQGLTKLRQIANHPGLASDDYQGDSGKMADVTYMLENAIGKDHKILIFSQFVKHLGILKKHLEQQKIPYAYLDGSTRNRQEEVRRFQENPNIPLFLISLKAGGLGLNLTAADYVFILDPWWNPAVESQAVDRAYRIGQENKVFIYKFITRGTVEEKILALQESKKQLANSLITTEDSFVKALSKDDIEGLLL